MSRYSCTRNRYSAADAENTEVAPIVAVESTTKTWTRSEEEEGYDNKRDQTVLRYMYILRVAFITLPLSPINKPVMPCLLIFC